MSGVNKNNKINSFSSRRTNRNNRVVRQGEVVDAPASDPVPNPNELLSTDYVDNRTIREMLKKFIRASNF